MRPASILPDASRPMPLLNLRGFAALYAMEVRRAVDGWQYAILAPVLTTLLFFAVFSLALGGTRAPVMGVAFLEFVAPGLVAMTALSTAFEAAGWSTIDSKVTGTMDSFVAAPLRPGEIVAAFLLAAMSAGLVNGALVLVCLVPLVEAGPADPLLMLGYGVAGTTVAAALGLAAGIWAEKFDHVASVQSFAVAPLVFLSGAFFPVADYGRILDDVMHANPFFWITDGIRQGQIGVGEAEAALTLPLAGIAAAVAALACQRLVAAGWRLRR